MGSCQVNCCAIKNGELLSKDCRKNEIDLDNIDELDYDYENKANSIVSVSKNE